MALPLSKLPLLAQLGHKLRRALGTNVYNVRKPKPEDLCLQSTIYMYMKRWDSIGV